MFVAMNQPQLTDTHQTYRHVTFANQSESLANFPTARFLQKFINQSPNLIVTHFAINYAEAGLRLASNERRSLS